MRYGIGVWLKMVTECFDSGTTMFSVILKAFWPPFRPNSPDRAPHPNPLPAKGGERERSTCAAASHCLLTSPRSLRGRGSVKGFRCGALSHNLAPPFAGRGRNSREAGISGEGQGTLLL